jgi:23S rRNA (guanine2535-N1)-methyltransferase
MVTERADHARFASGFVLHSAPGFPAYPVRLAQELFLRGLSHLHDRPVTLWDPCCGSGYLATVVGMLGREHLRAILASDVDPAAVELAGKNLALLAPGGLDRRAEQLRARHAEFGKPVHAEAAEAAQMLGRQFADHGGPVTATAAVADLFSPASLRRVLPVPGPDLVLADVPYGRQVHWAGTAPGDVEPLRAAVAGLCAVLDDHAVLAITAEARKVALDAGSVVLERFRIGTRAGVVARVGDLRDAA